MAFPAQEVAVRRIIACFAPGGGGSPQALTALARELGAEVLGLFIEDVDLLRLAALPFAAEVSFPSAALRTLDRAAIERSLRAEALRLRQSLAGALDPDIAWSLRVVRGTAAQAVAAALAEGYAPSLLVPPAGNARARHGVVREADLDTARLRALLDSRRPVLIVRG